jgi:hypothetical protein
MLSPMSPRPPSHQTALFAEGHSNVYKSGTGISNSTSRIRFIARPRVVLGQAVVDLVWKHTGKKNTQERVKFLGRKFIKYTTRSRL